MRVYIAIAITLFTLSGMAQKLPDWIINKPTPTNSTYLYVVESATGQTEMQARNRALGEVFRSTAMRIGQPFDSEEINCALQRGTEYYVISSQYNIPINKVCEYTDNKTSPCRVYVLCQVAKAGNIHAEFDDFNACYEGANKYFADEALYADGYIVSQNGRTLSDREIRTLFANSNSYDLYDKGIRMQGNPISGVIYGISGVTAAIGLGMQVCWLTGEPKIATAGLWIMGGGVATIITNLIIDQTIIAAGKAKIRKAVNLYNNGRMYSQSDIEMEYGLTGNGVYVTLSF